MNQPSKSLIFTGESINAMLVGRKWRTSRLRGLQAVNVEAERWEFCKMAQFSDGIRAEFISKTNTRMESIKCPWRIGETVYAKETWGLLDSNFHFLPHSVKKGRVVYRADHQDPISGDGPDVPIWRSPLFMPRWAARPELSRTITGITCGRVGGISAEDCIAEGMPRPIIKGNTVIANENPVGEFYEVWNSLHAHPKAIRANSQWAKALGWTKSCRISGEKHIYAGQGRFVKASDIVGHLSFPFSKEDGDKREKINEKSHKRCVSPFVWGLSFEKGERK